MKILVINGPNLNLLGIREPGVYGNKTYLELEAYLYEIAENRDIEIKIFQSNHEGDIIDEIHKAIEGFDGILINPAAFTHYSIAILDAIKGVGLPAVEVHLSDIKKREDFRKISVIKPACIDQVSGYGFLSYERGMDILIGYIN